MRIAVAVSGRGSNLRALVSGLDPAAGAEVVLVISNRADSMALEFARSKGIPTAVLERAADGAEWLDHLGRRSVDFVVLAGFLKKVPDEVVKAFPGRIINVHPALLPKFGGPGMYGLNVHRAALAAGERESGATVHLVTEAYDEGAVLGQARVPVEPDDTPESLAHRVLEAEHRLLPAAVRAAAAAGRAVPFTMNVREP